MGSRLEKNSEAVRKRIEGHSFDNEEGEEYEGSKFGGFSEYFRRKKLKLQNLDVELRSKSTDKPQIFKGIVAQVNGYTQPSLNDLHHLIVSHGGGFMQYLDGKTTVTHIIAANLTPKKAIEFRKYRIVKPAWVVDSVSTGKLLPWERYRVLDEGVGQKLLGFNDGKIVSQVNTKQRGYRDQTNTSWYTSQVKDIADDIDDGKEAHLDMLAGSGHEIEAYQRSPPQLHILDGNDNNQPKLSNSENFDMTSSFEDALNIVTSKQLTEPGLDLIKEDNNDDSGLNGSNADSPTSRFSYSRKRSRSNGSLSPSKKSKEMTAEEHNAILLADPHIRKSSTANPEFLKQFYSESRLHHLSTWKSDLKAKFQQMASERSPSQKQAQKQKLGARRYIMHVDFDSFFCAVSLKSFPQYVDKPTAVAHGSGPGSEIASCNYPARSFGIKNGMWMKKALKLCPEIKVLPYDFPAYEEASKHFYEAILDVGGIVQSVSIDEALVDISTLCLTAGPSAGHGMHEDSIRVEQEKADKIAQELRLRIKEMTGCDVSVGIGSNILLAKVALRRAKPMGQHQVKPEEILDFIGCLTLQDLPGVAYSIGGKLEEIGIKFVKDVRSLSKERLVTVLGPKTGEKIWDYARGVDPTPVGEQTIRKSVSAEVNWGIRFVSQPEAEEFVQNLSGELHRRLLDQGVKGRHLTMKIMKRSADAPMDPPKSLGHGKCDVFNKSVILGVATNSAEIIGRETVSILKSYGFSPGELRGLGIQMTKLEPLKGSAEGRPESSQKRISFNKSAPKFSRQPTEDPIIDDPDSPRKPKKTPIHPAHAIVQANALDRSAKKPLNIMGTQFLIPTQVDPAVLAELPMDIRSKLLAQHKRTSSRANSPSLGSRSQSPALYNEALPTGQRHGAFSRAQSPLSSRSQSPALPSQLDPDVLDALPDDVKAEVLASYNNRTSLSRTQGLLPQSPRKICSIQLKKPTTPTKRRRGRPRKVDTHSSLTQSAFVTAPRKGEPSKVEDSLTAIGEQGSDVLDPEFLAALPEEMRREVVAEHRRARLVSRAGLIASTSAAAKNKRQEAPIGQRKLRLQQREPKPTFTTAGLSTLPELRETLGAWYKEFCADGPHEDDVTALERYLRRVVLDERDMGKAAAVVRWIAWLVDGHDGPPDGRIAWKSALCGMKDAVQKAVAERGIGKLDL